MRNRTEWKDPDEVMFGEYIDPDERKFEVWHGPEEAAVAHWIKTIEERRKTPGYQNLQGGKKWEE